MLAVTSNCSMVQRNTIWERKQANGMYLMTGGKRASCNVIYIVHVYPIPWRYSQPVDALHRTFTGRYLCGRFPQWHRIVCRGLHPSLLVAVLWMWKFQGHPKCIYLWTKPCSITACKILVLICIGVRTSNLTWHFWYINVCKCCSLEVPLRPVLLKSLNTFPINSLNIHLREKCLEMVLQIATVKAVSSSNICLLFFPLFLVRVEPIIT